MPYRRFKRSKAAGRRYPRRVRRLPLLGAGTARVKRMYANNTVKIVRKGVTASVYNNSAGTAFETNSNWLTIGTGSAVPGALPNYFNLPFSAVFRISDLYNWSELQPIAEKVKLNYVKIYAYATSTTAAVNGVGQSPTILWDDKSVDDDVVPTYAAFKEQMGIKRVFLAQGKTAVMRPKLCCLAPAINGTTPGVNSLRVQKPIWLNTDSVSAATEHYGLNGVIEDLLRTAQTQSITNIKFDIEMGISLRGIK